MPPSLLSRAILIVPACALAALPARQTHAAFGDLLNSYSWNAYELATDPAHNAIYAASFATNSVQVVNLQTLQSQAIPVSGSPLSLGLSPDGATLYVATYTQGGPTGSITAIDTATRTVIRTLPLPVNPFDVKVGLGNRLFVAGGDASGWTGNRLMQIDAITGATTGADIANGIAVYGGRTQLSPDRTKLFFGINGLSPTTLYRYDVSTTTTSLEQSIQTGSNGQDLRISNNGGLLAHPNGAPYSIALYRPWDFSVVGSLNTGPYPRELAFAPDEAFAYTVNTQNRIDSYNLSTFSLAGSITGANAIGCPGQLLVDPSGRYLFASYTDSFWGYSGTRVYDTGRTPSPGLALWLTAPSLLAARRRRSSRA